MPDELCIGRHAKRLYLGIVEVTPDAGLLDKVTMSHHSGYRTSRRKWQERLTVWQPVAVGWSLHSQQLLDISKPAGFPAGLDAT